jgi:hypothetical protein
MKSINTTLKTGLLTALAIALPCIFAPQPASADWWEDFVTPNIDRARSETLGRAFKQVYIAELSSEDLEQLKTSQGGDWPATVTNWCNNEVSQQSNYSVPYLNSTWRVEGGKVNCYARMLWYK